MADAPKAALAGCWGPPKVAATPLARRNAMPIEHINPAGMHRNPAYSQAIVVPANARLLVIGGQNAVNAKGEVVGKGDMAAQTTQALDNLMTILKATGGSLEDLVRVGLYIRADADMGAGFRAWVAWAGPLRNPPTVTGIKVAGLAHPDFLIEIEATAALLS
jgi:enamine deaminase RidA (YjgF/YER057c/UK114 family)